MGMKLSIIIPIYNVEKYLPQCLDSLIAQTYTELEIIAVDDGSTDKSPEILDSYAKRDARIIALHKVNGGISSARNFGLNFITGNYFTFVDSDDWIDTDMYEKMMSCAKKTLSDIISTSSKIKKEKIFEKNIIKKYLLDGDVSCCNKVFSTKLLDKNSFVFDSGDVSIDVLGCYDLFSKCKRWSIVQGSFYNYRQDNLSYGRSGFCTKDLNAVRMTNLVLKSVQNNNPKFAKFAEYHVIHSEFDILNKAVMFGFKTEESKKTFDSIFQQYVQHIKKRILLIIFTRYFSRNEKFQLILISLSFNFFNYFKSKRGYKASTTKI